MGVVQSCHQCIPKEGEMQAKNMLVDVGNESRLTETREEQKEQPDVENGINGGKRASLAIPPVSAEKFYFFCILTVVVGILVSFQIQLNNQASVNAGLNTYGTLLSFVSSTVVLTALVYFLAEPGS